MSHNKTSKESAPLLGNESISSVDYLVRKGKHLANDESNVVLKCMFYVLFLVPVWLLVLLPVCVLTYPMKFFQKKDKSASKTIEHLRPPTSVTPKAERQYDLILYGATGFTGGLCLEYLLKQYKDTISYAIAGRNKSALQSVLSAAQKKTGVSVEVDILIGDSSKPDSLRPIVDSTRCLISTVGPFDLYGTPVVNLCALYGTDYADITGESDWMRKMIDNFDDIARKNGAHIVHHSGHDCWPWDANVMMVARELKSKLGEDLVSVESFDEIRGSGSGGTFATLLHSLTGRVQYKAQLPYDPLMKPQLGSPTTEKGASISRTDVTNQSILGFNKTINKWVGPFVMSAVMGNCIRRSNAVNQYSGSNKLKYSEAFVYPSLAAGIIDMIYLIIFGTCLQSPLLTSLLAKYYLPKPGQGPSEEDMDAGFLRLTTIGTGSKGGKAQATMFFNTDPGYRDTARMLVETGLTLSLESNRITVGGGVWTPACCMGDALTERLVKTGTKVEVKML